MTALAALVIAAPACVQPAPTDRALVAHAVDCGADPWLAAQLLDVEIHAGVPKPLRGMTLAAACHESRFSERVIRGRKRGDGGKAVGLLQMHPWWERYGVDRRDPIASAWAWLGRIVHAVPRAVKRGCARPWIAAWSWVAVGPRGRDGTVWSCEEPQHWRVLRGWRGYMR